MVFVNFFNHGLIIDISIDHNIKILNNNIN